MSLLVLADHPRRLLMTGARHLPMAAPGLRDHRDLPVPVGVAVRSCGPSATPPPRTDPATSATTERTPATPRSTVTPEPRTGMRLGVMGGTFDPIHHGHLVAASEVQSLFGLDEVVFVPTGEPWQKEGVTSSRPRTATS